MSDGSDAGDGGSENEREEEPLADLTERVDPASAGDDEPTPGGSEPDERGAPPPAEDTAADAPLGDLAERVRRRQGEEDEVKSAEESPFESMDVGAGAIDGEELWKELFEEGAEDERSPSVIGVGSDAEQVDTTAGQPEHVVAKEEFCRQCPFLGEPPELHCTHEGTEIVEVVDSERFRVRGCPMVGDDSTFSRS